MGKGLSYNIYIMIYATIKTDSIKAEEIRKYFSADILKDEAHPYDFFDRNYEGIHIHACCNKKGNYSITFSGEEEKVLPLVHYFSDDVTIKSVSEEKKDSNHSSIKEGWEDLGTQIGSDEVGKGDFFGPLIVTAAYVTKEDIPYLEKMKINDSKKMSDDYILEIGAGLKRRIRNYVVMVSADKLSRLYEQKYNIDRILSICHNAAQKGLIKKYGLPDFIITYIDEFLSEKNYRKYVLDDIIQNPLYFRTKGETYYPSVAAASVISRYTFLKEWEKMEEALQARIPKGAGGNVDSVYGRLRNQDEKVDLYVKRFFNNYKKRIK